MCIRVVIKDNIDKKIRLKNRQRCRYKINNIALLLTISPFFWVVKNRESEPPAAELSLGAIIVMPSLLWGKGTIGGFKLVGFY